MDIAANQFNTQLNNGAKVVPDNADVALDYAKRGFAVFPVRDWGDGEGRKPIKGFPELASADLVEVGKWWSRHPDACVGLLCGERNGITVLDIDRKNGKDGFATLAGLGFADHREMSPVRAITKSAGAHLVFRYEPRLKNSVGVIGAGLDVKTQGGFIIATGSHIDDRPYLVDGACLGEAELPAFPESLIPPPKPERSPVVPLSDPATNQIEWAGEVLTKRAERLASMPEGEREGALNSLTLWAGGAAAWGFLTLDIARPIITDAALQSGLKRGEIAAKFRRGGAWDDGLAKPISDFPAPITGDDFDELDDDNPFNELLLKSSPAAKPDGKALGTFPLTEDGVALGFVARNSGRLRYCHTSAAWYAWTETHWRRDETKLAFSFARRECRLAGKGNPEAKALSKAAAAAAVERFAQSDRAFAVTGDYWDRDPWLLGTPGGVVDLRSGQIRSAVHTDAITRLTAVAPDGDAACPVWLRFLDDATAGDAALIRFLQQWCGYSLTGDTREHALLFVYGPGGNGKSVFLNTVTAIMGDYVRTAGMDVFSAGGERHTQELARLRAARMVCASETEEGRAWAEVKIKQLTGGDKITARFMRQNDFEFRPEFKLTVVGNHKPLLRNVDAAARRRFNIVPFEHQPANPDRDLEGKLRAEYPGILAWMVADCLDWQANGLVRPEIVASATAEYFSDQDVFGQWLEDRCHVAPSEVCSNADLFHSYQRYAQGRGEGLYGKSRGFPDALRARGFVPIKDSMGIKGRGFAGLRVRNDFDDAPDEFDGLL